MTQVASSDRNPFGRLSPMGKDYKDAFERLSDPAIFKGVHKQRFDANATGPKRLQAVSPRGNSTLEPIPFDATPVARTRFEDNLRSGLNTPNHDYDTPADKARNAWPSLYGAYSGGLGGRHLSPLKHTRASVNLGKALRASEGGLPSPSKPQSIFERLHDPLYAGSHKPRFSDMGAAETPLFEAKIDPKLAAAYGGLNDD